jgi:hypothetical protein
VRCGEPTGRPWRRIHAIGRWQTASGREPPRPSQRCRSLQNCLHGGLWLGRPARDWSFLHFAETGEAHSVGPVSNRTLRFLDFQAGAGFQPDLRNREPLVGRDRGGALCAGVSRRIDSRLPLRRSPVGNRTYAVGAFCLLQKCKNSRPGRPAREHSSAAGACHNLCNY